MGYTMLNNELIRSENTPSATGEVFIAVPGNCSMCHLMNDCEDLKVPVTAREFCKNYKMWIKK